jgi:hypothetical protein
LIYQGDIAASLQPSPFTRQDGTATGVRPSPRIRQGNTKGTPIPFPVPLPAQTNSSVASVLDPEACRRYTSLKIEGRETCVRPACDKYPSVAPVEVFLPSCHTQRRDEPAPVVVHELVVYREHILRLSKACLCPNMRKWVVQIG